MSRLGSLFVSVTWGAGGSTAEKSLELAHFVQEQGNTTCLHLTCTNMDEGVLANALDRAKALGIRNILALRGDPPRGKEYWGGGGGHSASSSSSSSEPVLESAKSSEPSEPSEPSFEFCHAVDLVRFIRKLHGDYFCIGVAGYPEGHVDGADTAGQDPATDIPFLLEKVEAGADFIITQLFYDVEKFLDYEQLLRSHSSPLLQTIPIIPGLMPINTYQSFVRASRLSHASVPIDLLDSFNSIPNGNDERVKELGVEVLSNIVAQIFQKTQGRVNGFHFYTLNLEKAVALILDKCPVFSIPATTIMNANKELVGDFGSIDVSTNLSDAAHQEVQIGFPATKVAQTTSTSSAASETEGHTHTNSINKVPHPKFQHDILSISSGEGSLGREADWDDFPNGRFGDSRSPAYGEVVGYGARSLHVANSNKTTSYRRLWGHPTCVSDITALFQKHITGELESIPWSDQPLNAETMLIQEELLQLNARGLWTVASQPACNAAKSEDKIFGWGPKNGLVFQKPFVEFFASPDECARIKGVVDGDSEMFAFYASNARGVLVSNLAAAGSSNAVTWGVFPNKEILQSTIIEEESFQTWAEEAFRIWKEWQRLYPRHTETYKFLDDIYNSYSLVTIVYHDYMIESALWDILLEKTS